MFGTIELHTILNPNRSSSIKTRKMATNNRNLTGNDSYALITRGDDANMFLVKVLNITPANMALIMNCQDPRRPANHDEAVALYHAWSYCKQPIPDLVLQGLNGTIPPPPRRTVYVLLPWSENKGDVENFALERDRYYRITRRHEGGVSRPEDHNNDRLMAMRLNFPSAVVSVPPPDSRVLQQQIQQLNADLMAERQARQTAETNFATAQQALTFEQQNSAAISQQMDFYKTQLEYMRTLHAAPARGSAARGDTRTPRRNLAARFQQQENEDCDT